MLANRILAAKADNGVNDASAAVAVPGGAWLVTGATGGVGQFLLERMAASGEPAIALSRDPPAGPTAGAIAWLRGDLQHASPPVAAGPVRVLSAGPLDAFSRWASRAAWPAGTRIVALSSMSATTKLDQAHPSERAVAEALLAAEGALQALCPARGWSLVLLRPTLVWGRGDRSITPLLALASRLRALPLPSGSRGRRQPVHADDLAAAMLAAMHEEAVGTGPWPAGGGEVLGFDEMLARSLRAAGVRGRLLRLPDLLARPVEALAARLPGVPGRMASQMSRARRDLDVDDRRIWERLGLDPRGFRPGADAFPGLGRRPESP